MGGPALGHLVQPRRVNGRGALTWARIAGGAWLVGFALFAYVGIGPLLRLEVGPILIGLLTHGLWTLLLGLRWSAVPLGLSS